MTSPEIRPALRYYGGKFRLAPWIINNLPPHSHYVEPFAGAASVLLQKPRSYCETYNDADGDVVAFFRTLRDRPDELIEAIRLTPYALEELQYCQADPGQNLPDLEKARRLYTRAMQSRGNIAARRRTGWRRWKDPHTNRPSCHTWTELDHLYRIADRLQGIQIEHDTALNVIARYDHPQTLFYCDPPYPASTRSPQWNDRAYTHEMSDDDHRQLAQVLHSIRGMALISSYPSELYDTLYAGWATATIQARVEQNTPRTEILYLSPHAAEQLEHDRRAHQPAFMFRVAQEAE